MYEAALIAGLRPLSFIGENAAAALQMTISRNDLSTTNSTDKIRVIMYNLGASALKVSLVEIGKLETSNKGGKSKDI